MAEKRSASFCKPEYKGMVHRVLVLCQTLPQANEFQALVNSAKYPSFQFIYPTVLGPEPQDYNALYMDCIELICHDTVHAIIAVRPGLELLQAAIAERFPQTLNAPAMESGLLCIHRYFCQRYITTGFCGASTIFQPGELDLNSAVSHLEEAGIPCLAKDCYNIDIAYYSRRIKSPKHLLRKVKKITESIWAAHQQVSSFLYGRLDDLRYGMLRDNPWCMLEEYWDPASCPITVHRVTCYVCQSEFIPWIISDVNYWPHISRCIQADCVPTSLEEASQFQIWAVIRECVQRLISHGFDHQLALFEVLYEPGGQVRVVEVQANLDVRLSKLFEHVYRQGDMMQALIDVAIGRAPPHPKLIQGRFAMRAYIVVFTTGLISDLLNCNVAKSRVNISLLMDEKCYLVADKDHGQPVATVIVTGSSRSECEQEICTVVNNLVKEETDCTWRILS